MNIYEETLEMHRKFSGKENLDYRISYNKGIKITVVPTGRFVRLRK